MSSQEKKPDEQITLHVDSAEQTVPPMSGAQECYRCGTELEIGFGLAGGGYGVYEYCPKCAEVIGKDQEED